jgi:hypothetical protein
MFSKKKFKGSGFKLRAQVGLSDQCLLHNHDNFMLFNNPVHARQFIEHYTAVNGFKRMYGLTHLLPDLALLPLEKDHQFKKNDVVIFEPEGYIMNTHTVLLSSKKMAGMLHDHLPAHQIIVAGTSQVFPVITDAMEQLRSFYKKSLPTGITSVDLTLKPKILLVLINH